MIECLGWKSEMEGSLHQSSSSALPLSCFLILSPNRQKSSFGHDPPGAWCRSRPGPWHRHVTQKPSPTQVSDNWVTRQGVPRHVGRGQGDRPGAEEKVARSFE